MTPYGVMGSGHQLLKNWLVAYLASNRYLTQYRHIVKWAPRHSAVEYEIKILIIFIQEITFQKAVCKYEPFDLDLSLLVVDKQEPLQQNV